MLYTLWRVNDTEQSAIEITSGSQEDMRLIAAECRKAASSGIRYEVLPAGGAPFDARGE